MIFAAPDKIAHFTAQGWWGTQTLWDLFLRNVAQRGDEEAAVDAPNRADFAHGAPMRLGWSALAREVDRFSLLLLDHGIRRDEVLVSQLPNCVEQLIVYLACARLGIVVSPVPVQFREHELNHVLPITQAAAVVTFRCIGKPGAGHAAAAMYRALQPAHPALRKVFAWGDAQADGSGAVVAAPPLHDAPIAAPDRERVLQAEAAAAVDANDIFTLCWTSGTEAQPKGVPRSHNQWLIVAPSIIEAAELRPHARLLNPFPLVNMAGFATAFATWLVLGGTVVQHQPFLLPVFLRQLREERIDYTVAPPAILNLLLRDDALLQGIDFQRLSRIGSGSAPLSDWMVRGFAERYGVQVVNYFGSNEGAALASGFQDVPQPQLRAQLFPRPGVPGFDWSVSTTRKVRMRLVDLATGDDILEGGRPGELRVAGPTIFDGYWGAPEQTARAFDAQGFYKSGDLFEIAGDQGQYLRYVGRSKDLVIRGGVNISPEEIENLLAACPGVKEAAVVGVPDDALGEKVCACVVAAEGHQPSLTGLTDFLRDEKRIAAFKLPEYLLLLDALPRNPVGKILKRTLREQARKLGSAPWREAA